jgi:diaminohydroxyphosphoribosylaminopyrimidine deaminase/5-amino-6-(5-phosphoribosylamino)uracil reductase
MGDSDEKFLLRAMNLAMQGRGAVEPNPMVGCVIVKDGRIIGEGFHAQYGGPHAEPTALAACNEDPRGATAYVTLEPCCHLNKQTPPCAPRLIKAGIARVVLGCLDPNPDVNGRGVAMLREAGIAVDGPFLEAEFKQLIAPFIARTVLRRPYVTLKWAQTADGKIAGPGGQRMQISNEQSMQLVHKLRSRCDAILVGINTVLADDPRLTTRRIDNPRPLIRCVLDRNLRIPMESNLVRTARDSRVIVFCDAEQLNQARVNELRAAGVELQAASGISDALTHLHGQRVSHLLVEPGPTLAKLFFEDGLCDRVWRFDCARCSVDAAIDAASVPPSFRKIDKLRLSGDTLVEYLNPDSQAFFAAIKSADIRSEMKLYT